MIFIEPEYPSQTLVRMNSAPASNSCGPSQSFTPSTIQRMWHIENSLIRTSVYDKFSGATKIVTHLDHISHCTTAFGTNWSNRWTHRAFLMNNRRD